MKGNPNQRTIPYGAIKKAIVRCSKPNFNPNIPSFTIDLERLAEEVKRFNLVVIPGETKSRRLELHDVTLVQEYFFGENLTWFTEGRQLMDVIFMDERDVDPDTAYMIEMLKNPEHPDDPDFDSIHALATILCNKRCWVAQVASYKSNDPTIIAHNDGVGLFIALRANKVVLKQDSYEYNQDDI